MYSLLMIEVVLQEQGLTIPNEITDEKEDRIFLPILGNINNLAAMSAHIMTTEGEEPIEIVVKQALRDILIPKTEETETVNDFVQTLPQIDEEERLEILRSFEEKMRLNNTTEHAQNIKPIHEDIITPEVIKTVTINPDESNVIILDDGSKLEIKIAEDKEKSNLPEQSHGKGHAF